MITMRITGALTTIIFLLINISESMKSRAQSGDEEIAIKAVVRAFFDRYSAKDLEGAMSLWSENSPAYHDRKAALQEIFSQTGEIKLKSLSLGSIRIVDMQARAPVAVELSGKDKATGRDSPHLGKLDRCVYLSKEEGAWRIWLYAPSSLIDALFSARGKPERLWLLKQEHEQVTEVIFDGFLAQGQKETEAGKFDQALWLNDIALDIATVLDRAASQAWSHQHRGQIYVKQGDYAGALGSFSQALHLFWNELSKTKIVQQHLKPSTQQERLLRRLELGEAPEAIAKEIADESKSAAHYAGLKDGEASALDNLGVAYTETGRYAEAFTSWNDALASSQELEQWLPSANFPKENQSTILNNLGLLYFKTGQNAEALAKLNQSLESARRFADSYKESAVLNNRALVYHAMKKDEDAETDYRQSLQIARARSDIDGQTSALNNLAIIRKELRQYKQAEDYLAQSLSLAQSAKDRASEVRSKIILGSLYYDEGRYSLAEPLFEAGVNIAAAMGSPEIGFLSYSDLGDVYRAQKRWAKAAGAYRQAISLIENIRGATKEQSLQTGFFEQYTEPYRSLAICSLQLSLPPEDAFAISESGKARALVDLLTRSRSGLKGITAEERRKERELDFNITRLTAELTGGNSDGKFAKDADRVKQQLESARNEYSEFRRDLFLRYPDLKTQQAGFDLASLSDLNESVLAREPGVAVLSYLVTKAETILFVIRSGAAGGQPVLKTLRLPLKRDELIARARDFWRQCQTGGQQVAARRADVVPVLGARTAYQAAAAELFQSLIAPAEPELAGKTHLVIIPDGALNRLPFQALMDKRGKFLIERYAVSYAPSVTALIKMIERARRNRALNDAAGKKQDSMPMLVMGHAPRLGKFGDLPATESETRAIASMFRVSPFIGEDASEGRAKAEMGRARYIHFAVHGDLNEAAPMYSAVVLARDQQEDGLLHAREILDLDLKAELVVLSACQTALGQEVNGEGIVGLSWSLFVAGASSTVVSQWPVRDDSTRELMANFYARLKTQGGRPDNFAAALREAQLSLLRGRGYRGPYFWAPFVLVGAW